MKLLNGQDLAGFIKQRHAQQVRRLNGAKILPKLAIVQLKDDPVIDLYVRLKLAYGQDIGAAVEVYKPSMQEVDRLIRKLNEDGSVHGIIVQLPLPEPDKTEQVVNLILPAKDVDALSKDARYQPATPQAILWLLAAYNIDLKDKKILLIGRGKLVGEPLKKILRESKVDVDVVIKGSVNLAKLAKSADVIISAANEPAILSAGMLKQGAIVVDAGVAEADGKTTGNVSQDVYERDDITITPQKGGVGPITVCALFDNLLISAQNSKQ